VFMTGWNNDNCLKLKDKLFKSQMFSCFALFSLHNVRTG